MICYEKMHEPLISRAEFLLRLLGSFCMGLCIVAVALSVGMLGYHEFEQMTWIDAFLNASMILSDMGPASPLSTTAGKIFAACYALFSGLAFIFIVGTVFAPIFHRFLHKFHQPKSIKTCK
ncbi:MAG TPA: hypothetical protein VHZ76_06970 [Gammaproteobacteria bacterium]|jgi:hypothetical protein|nr:hypothetical protein [Gammaproteobacteria bacterium]